jgi:pimeloyl-ACP methyl ester carboxylesterase
MAITTNPTERPPTPDEWAGAGHSARTGHIRRIIAGSIASGMVGATVLTLIVFAGASEHVITGSTLLAFAIGWAMLAVLSTRITDQPQRWALVPATAMAATGLGLLILAPRDGALTAAGWVWPPALLVLAVWTGMRVRRSLGARSGRWVLYPVVAVMAAAAVGGAVETVALATYQNSYPMPGQSYDVGGYRLHLNCTGSGGPTVVLHSGLGEMSSSWARVAPAVAGTTRVCAYDRAGQGWSDDAPHIQDGLQAAADLHTLLDRAGENGPYVLVGHSIGGSYAMTYAARYPEQVAGMVLLDSSDPYQATGTAGSTRTSAPSWVAILPSVARLGIGQLVPAATWSSLPEPAAGQVAAFLSSPRGWRNSRDEFATMPDLFRPAQALRTLGNKPLVLVTASESVQTIHGWSAAQDRMAALSTTISHRIADSTHGALLDGEREAVVSTRAIHDVVQVARTGAPLPSN